jgi:hypothetical protein
MRRHDRGSGAEPKASLECEPATDDSLARSAVPSPIHDKDSEGDRVRKPHVARCHPGQGDDPATGWMNWPYCVWWQTALRVKRSRIV